MRRIHTFRTTALRGQRPGDERSGGAWLWPAAFLVLSLCAAPARATIDGPDCVVDSDCEPGLLCAGNCTPEEEICTDSSQCEGESICSLRFDACPSCEDDCPERCSVPNGFCQTLVPPCTSDAECADDELCWFVNPTECAATDDVCLNTSPLGCAKHVAFCAANAAYPCLAGQTCFDGERCAPPSHLELAASVTRDPDKSERKRKQQAAAQKTNDAPAQTAHPECSLGYGARAPAGLALPLLLAGLGLMTRRTARCRPARFLARRS